MFHVKHWLWCRWYSGRRRARLWGRAAVCAGGRRPAREPSALRAFGSARRLEARPGPATAHRHRGKTPGPYGALHTGGTWCAGVWPALALPPPTAPPQVIQNAQLASESPVIRGYVESYTFSTQKSRHFPPISVSRSPAPRPGNAGRPRRALWNTSPIAAHGLHGLAHLPWHVLVPMRWSSAK